MTKCTFGKFLVGLKHLISLLFNYSLSRPLSDSSPSRSSRVIEFGDGRSFSRALPLARLVLADRVLTRIRHQALLSWSARFFLRPFILRFCFFAPLRAFALRFFVLCSFRTSLIIRLLFLLQFCRRFWYIVLFWTCSAWTLAIANLPSWRFNPTRQQCRFVIRIRVLVFVFPLFSFLLSASRHRFFCARAFVHRIDAFPWAGHCGRTCNVSPLGCFFWHPFFSNKTFSKHRMAFKRDRVFRFLDYQLVNYLISYTCLSSLFFFGIVALTVGCVIC